MSSIGEKMEIIEYQKCNICHARLEISILADFKDLHFETLFSLSFSLAVVATCCSTVLIKRVRCGREDKMEHTAHSHVIGHHVVVEDT